MQHVNTRPNPMCPRDGAPLTRGTGALGEDVCGACQGRFLDEAATRRLFVDVMGIRDDVLVERARVRSAAQRIACPACASRMTETHARGVLVDLCRGCGGAWLDDGEMARLARDVVDEVRVAPSTTPAPDPDLVTGTNLVLGDLELDRRAPPPSTIRFAVYCVNCDLALDLTQVNWLINTRPWCPECAKPHASVFAGFGESLAQIFVHFVLYSAMVGRSLLARAFDPTSGGDGIWSRQPDVLRIAPEDADKYFGSFFVRVR